MSRRHLNFYTCDGPTCDKRWSGEQQIYMEGDGAMLDFCSWCCVTVYSMRAEDEHRAAHIQEADDE